jgi:Zn-dependent protease
MRAYWNILTVWGIPIRLHVSLLLLPPLLFRVFGVAPFTILFAAVGVMASIVLHELGHCWVAQRKNCRVREIQLLLIGGAAQMERIPTRPRDELAMALAGPLVSLLLAGVFWGVGLFLPLSALLAGGLRTNAFLVLAVWNLGLVLFNLIPAFPMDGGRVLRALLAMRMSRVRATWIASRIGRLGAVTFGAWGVWVMFDGALLQGAVLAAIASFIYRAAGDEYRMVRLLAATEHGAAGPVWPVLEAPPGDEVVIEPSPYRGGRPQHSEIRPF